MTTFNTGNSVPSTDARDLSDNAQTLDSVVNGVGVATSRTGKQLRSLDSLEAEFIAKANIAAAQYTLTAINSGVWATGQIFTAVNQYMVFSGTAYKPRNSTTLPYVVGASPVSDANVEVVANASTAQIIADLSQSYTFKTLALMKSSLIIFPNGKRIFWQGYYAESDGGSNWGVVTSGTHTDDGGSIFTLADGKHIVANLKGKKLSTRKFGVVDSSTTDSAVQFQSAVDFAKSRRQVLRIQSGSILLGQKINIPPSFEMHGQGVANTSIFANGDYTLFEHTTRFVVKGLVVNQLDPDFMGIAFGNKRTNDPSNQSYFNDFSDVGVNGFDFSWWMRTSLFCTWSNCISRSVIGIRFAMVADPYDVTSNAASGWNQFAPSLGWFHNAGVVKNSVFEDEEVGIYGCPMAYEFTALTTQGINGDKANNKILPVSEERTGLFLHSGRDIDQAWGNVVTSYYGEFTNRMIYAKNQRSLIINGAFAQGGSSSNRSYCVLDIDNSNVYTEGVRGQDWFDQQGIIRNNGKLFGRLAGASDSPAINIQDTSRHYGNREQEEFTRKFSFSSGSGSDSFTIPVALNNHSHYDLRIGGLYDGFSYRHAAYDVFKWSSDALTGVRLRSGTETSFNVSVSGGKLIVNKTGSQPMSFQVVMTEISGAVTMTEALTAD